MFAVTRCIPTAIVRLDIVVYKMLGSRWLFSIEISGQFKFIFFNCSPIYFSSILNHLLRVYSKFPHSLINCCRRQHFDQTHLIKRKTTSLHLLFSLCFHTVLKKSFVFYTRLRVFQSHSIHLHNARQSCFQ